MHYENPLDNIIHRFQHRWETDRQYRAAMSGVFGLLLIFVLCSGVGLLDMGATRVLAAVGIGGTTADQGGGSSQQDSETGVKVGNSEVFPTPGVPTWAAPLIPAASPNPSSGTPAPTPTPSPTPTDVATTGPCKTNCGGGARVAVTGSTSPTHWLLGQPASIYFFTSNTSDGSALPNDGINAFIHWPNGAQWLSADPQFHAPASTDSTGNATWTITVPTTGQCGGTVKIDISANDHGTAVYGNPIYVRCN
jgi:hypothetical protein